MQEITIEVGTDGKTTVTTKGFRGNACKKETEALKKVLGKTTSESSTPEMYENERATSRSGN